jgi:hypothetical protein
VLQGISLMKTPLAVSIPSVNGQTSTNTTSSRLHTKSCEGHVKVVGATEDSVLELEGVDDREWQPVMKITGLSHPPGGFLMHPGGR